MKHILKQFSLEKKIDEEEKKNLCFFEENI